MSVSDGAEGWKVGRASGIPIVVLNDVALVLPIKLAEQHPPSGAARPSFGTVNETVVL